MSQKFYINKIFEPIVKFWINTYYDFVLEKDGDLGYKLGKSNIVYIWEEANDLNFILIVTYYQSLLQSKIADNLSSNIFINIYIEMIIS